MRLVDADEIIVALDKQNNDDLTDYTTWFLRDFIDTLAQFKSIDAVPVVRCGNCKHSIEMDGTHWRLCDKLSGSLFDEAFYCSAGELKEGDVRE